MINKIIYNFLVKNLSKIFIKNNIVDQKKDKFLKYINVESIQLDEDNNIYINISDKLTINWFIDQYNNEWQLEIFKHLLDNINLILDYDKSKLPIDYIEKLNNFNKIINTQITTLKENMLNV